ncbi:MAG: methylenetetrahydrofolate reductase [NAD(P)H] [Bacteriovoracaceae bacterium]|nr:methylenetetrahydrofolate reductase [NAD(P)H] [Bacteriovoracaceae bacterium]
MQHISEILKQNQTTMSFEFFPPKNDLGMQDLLKTIKGLIPLKPAYVSITYGAGGSTQKYTHDLLVKLKEETELVLVAHLTCVSHTKDEIYDILTKYDRVGIDNIMALRGDPQTPGAPYKPIPGGFEYAYELVEFIKKKFPHMGIGVAGFCEGHPETPNRLKEMEYLKNKVDAGADYICTQMFFDNRDFFDFSERASLVGIKVPIIAGIMPITSSTSMKRMGELALGARFPAKLLRAIARADSEDLVKNVGEHWATQQVSDLLDNQADGIHFYTLNKSKSTQNIYKSIGIKDSSSL